MKRLLPLVLVSFLAVIALPATAGLKLPRDIHQASDLDGARAAARESGKPVAILYTDKDSTCPLCNNAASAMIDEVERAAVLVYASTKSGLPENVQAALSREGKYIPKLVVYDPELETELGLVIYERVKADPRDAFEDLKKALREYRKQQG